MQHHNYSLTELESMWINGEEIYISAFGRIYKGRKQKKKNKNRGKIQMTEIEKSNFH